MRRIVAFNRVSADGYFAAPDGSLDWTVTEPELDRVAADNLSGAGTMLFGRRTYEMFESYWPHAVDEDPHAAGRHTPEIRAIAEWINASTKIVFSRTRTEVPWRNSRLLPTLDPREIEALKARPGGDIMVFGSGSIVSQLTEHGLIDEYQFVVSPVLLGDGQLLVRGVSRSLRLDLLESKAYPTGTLMLRYAPAKASG